MTRAIFHRLEVILARFITDILSLFLHMGSIFFHQPRGGGRKNGAIRFGEKCILPVHFFDRFFAVRFLSDGERWSDINPRQIYLSRQVWLPLPLPLIHWTNLEVLTL
jgi:hypothetical protein